MESIALTQEDKLQIVSMYSSAALSILAVATEPGWNVVGTFPLDVSARARLDLIASVSDESLVLTARFFCISIGFVGELAGSRASISSLVDTRALSAFVDMSGGRLYQVQAQVVGDAGDAFFGIVRRASPSGNV